MATILPNPPSVVEYGTRRFLIFDAPNDDNLDLYIREFKKRNIVHVVRACEPTYDAERLKHVGIDVTDVMFQDGGSPPKDVVDKWRSVCRSVFKRTDEPMIGVHCVAGLGRAPVLVAIALIEEGMDPLDAVEYIRQYRRGAINTNQLRWLRNYKKSGGGGCSLM